VLRILRRFEFDQSGFNAVAVRCGRSFQDLAATAKKPEDSVMKIRDLKAKAAAWRQPTQPGKMGLPG